MKKEELRNENKELKEQENLRELDINTNQPKDIEESEIDQIAGGKLSGHSMSDTQRNL